MAKCEWDYELPDHDPNSGLVCAILVHQGRFVQLVCSLPRGGAGVMGGHTN